MQAYLIRRLLLAIPTLVIITIILFGAVRLIPGDVVTRMVSMMARTSGGGGRYNREQLVAEIERSLGLDVPVHVQKDIRHNLEGPSRQYPLGTDQFGRDTLTRIIYGAQVSMFVGVGAGLLQLVIAASLGLISGYWGGKFDLVLQRFVDAIMTFPWLFLTLTIMSLLGPGVLQIILVLGFQWGIANVRTIRAVVLSTRENVYVEAARAVGCPTPKILLRQILPHNGARVATGHTRHYSAWCSAGPAP